MPLTAQEPDRRRTKIREDVVLSAMDRPIVPVLITTGRVVVGIGAILLACAVAFVYLRSDKYRTLIVDADRISVSEVSYGIFHEYIPVAGKVVPRTSVYLDAIDGGQVEFVHVEAGDIVSAGDALVTLKNTRLQLEVTGREAQLAEQLNNLSTTSLSIQQNRLRHERELIDSEYEIGRLSRHLAQLQPLFPTGASSQSELDDLEAELDYQLAVRNAVLKAQRLDKESQSVQIDALRNAIESMNQNLTITRKNLENLVVAAPISGHLTSLEAIVGESKAPGQRIGQIDQLNAFKVSASVDEYYLSTVTIGQLASVTIERSSYELEVVKVYPDVRNHQLELDLSFLEEPPKFIRRGQTVNLRIQIGRPAETLVLENGAFYGDTGGAWVFVLDSQGEFAERRNVRVGRRNPEEIEIIEGLDNGERVITSSYRNFMDVDRVHLKADKT